MIQINLLPWRDQERTQQQKRFGMVVGVFAGFGVFCTLVFHMHYSAKISNQIQRNVILQAASDQEANTLADLNKQKKKLTQVDQKLHYIFELRESSYRAVRLLNELVLVDPESITLQKIVRNGNAITVSGKAKSNLQITLFMENIEKSKFFAQPVLTEINGKENTTGEDRSFELKIIQKG
ncbi:MAG TPA: PilN domain-containing protein [Gammaproteobacteria bacterium]|jgi:type IV pilus assembly protein PilN|nr:PilN domain-containing protein [Gammaproteobacteria bacterium]